MCIQVHVYVRIKELKKNCVKIPHLDTLARLKDNCLVCGSALCLPHMIVEIDVL